MNNINLAGSLLKAFIPFPDTARRLKRKFRPYEPDSTNSGFTFDDGLEMLAGLQKVGAKLSGDILEVGSGWTPTIPLMFHLAGAETVTLTDLERLFDDTSVPTADRFLRPRLKSLAERMSMDRVQMEARFATFRPTYLCPWRADRHGADTVDIAISRAVMEHVPAGDVAGLFRNLHRIVRPGGFMCHSVDNTDHFQHGDGKASLIDFLRYPTESFRWRLSQVNIQGRMNRLRHSDYLAIAEETGWRVVLESGRMPATVLREVLSMKMMGHLAPEFAARDPQDLATTATLLIAYRDH